MTDSGFIQEMIWKGYADAASILGSLYDFYRPAADCDPAFWTDRETGKLNNLLFQRHVSLNAEDMKYSKPNKYAKATWYALMDGCDLKPGDYFVGESGTFFIAAMQPLLPILAVECNRVVSISRPLVPLTFGAGGYSAISPNTQAPFVLGVPCSILQGTKGEKNDVAMPADTRLPWWVILMPAGVGTVRYGDMITDERGARYIVSSAELTDLGYRLTAMMAIA